MDVIRDGAVTVGTEIGNNEALDLGLYLVSKWGGLYSTGPAWEDKLSAPQGHGPTCLALCLLRQHGVETRPAPNFQIEHHGASRLRDGDGGPVHEKLSCHVSGGRIA